MKLMRNESPGSDSKGSIFGSPWVAGASLTAAIGLLVALAVSTGGSDELGPDETTSSIAVTEPESGEFHVDTIEDPEPIDTRVSEWVQAKGPGVGGRLTALAYNPEDSDRIVAAGDVFGISWTDDAGATWGTTTGLTNWEIGDVVFDPDNSERVWAGTMGGPFLSTDGGKTWTAKRVGMPEVDNQSYTAPIETVLFDPTQNGRLLAFGGSQRRYKEGDGDVIPYGTVWESLDNGDTWAQLGSIPNGGNIVSATFVSGSGDTLIVAVNDVAAAKCARKKASEEACSSGNSGAVPANGGVFRSEDGGATWTQSNDGLRHNNVTDIVAHPTDPNRAWVTLRDGPLVDGDHLPGGVYVTSDGGQSWESANEGLSQTSREVSGVTSRYEQIVVSASDPSRLYTADIGYGTGIVYRSDDGGFTWEPTKIDVSLELVDAYSTDVTAREFAIDPADPDSFIMAHDEFILISDDAGETANDLTTSRTASGNVVGRGFSGIVATQVVFNPYVADDVTLLGFDGGNFIQSTDGLASYRRTIGGDSPDGGDDIDWFGAWKAAYAGEDGQRIYVLLGQASQFQAVARSDDGGESFTLVRGESVGLPERYETEQKGTALLVDPNDIDTVYIVLDEQLLRSTDGAQTFSPFGNYGSVHDLVLTDDGTVYLSSSQGLYRSTDGGATGQLVEGAPTDLKYLASDPHDSNAVLVISQPEHVGEGDTPGLYHFDGETWTYLLEESNLQQVAAHPDRAGVYVVVSQDLPFHDVSYATGVSVTTDGGESWVKFNDGLPILRVSAVAFDPHESDTIVIGTYGRGFYYSSFSGLIGEPLS